MTTPRPDQRHAPGHAGTAGSRSGSGDLAASLGFPGSPATVQNIQTARQVNRGTGGSPWNLVTFPSPARLWAVVLTFAVRATGTPGSTACFAAVETNISGLTLAIVNLGLVNTGQVDSGQSEPPIPGIPVTQGDSVILDVNGGLGVTGADQVASAIVYYSTP